MRTAFTALLLLGTLAATLKTAESAAGSRRQLLQGAGAAVSAAAKDLDPKSQQLIDCLQQPVIRKGLRKSASKKQKAAAGIAIAQCFVDNLDAFVPPKAQNAGEETASAAGAGPNYQSLSNVVNALLPAQLIVNAVNQLVIAKEAAAAQQVLQLFVANTGCAQELLKALSPFNKEALASLLAKAALDPSVLIGNCTAQDVPPLLLALAATHCPNNTLIKCNASNNNFGMFETRPGAQLAAATSTLLLRKNRTVGVTLGRTAFKMALAVSQVSSAATCKNQVSAFLASVPSDGTYNVTANGLNLLCDTTIVTSPSTGFKPSLLLQTGCIDPINAIAKAMKSVYKGMLLQAQYPKQVQFYCGAWKDILTFGPSAAPVSLFTAAPTGYRCMLEGGPVTCATLPFGFLVEPTLDEIHDLSYTTDANGKVNSIFPCPYS
eukprot:gene6646-6871_t